MFDNVDIANIDRNEVFVVFCGIFSFLWILSFSNESAAAILKKFHLFVIGFFTLICSTDARGKPRFDPDLIKNVPKGDLKVKRIIFIRHGESDWNEVFNRGFGPSFFVRLFKAICYEISLLVTRDSTFIDSSLSPLGISQARKLREFVEAEIYNTEIEPDRTLLRGYVNKNPPLGRPVTSPNSLNYLNQTEDLVFGDKSVFEKSRGFTVPDENVDERRASMIDADPSLNNLLQSTYFDNHKVTATQSEQVSTHNETAQNLKPIPNPTSFSSCPEKTEVQFDLAKEEEEETLACHCTSSVIVCSNLRRAIATAAIGLQYRVQRTGEKMIGLSYLQEISRNIDANAIAGPREIPDLHILNDELWDGYEPENVFDMNLNLGNKAVLGSSGLERMKGFCNWAFNRNENTIIVGGGHSLWFKKFFNTYLPFKLDHISKKKKMQNCAVIAFNLTSASYNGQIIYRIDPDSISVVYKGFQ